MTSGPQLSSATKIATSWAGSVKLAFSANRWMMPEDSNHIRVERAMADLDVTQPQFAVLTMLANYPGLSNADLARLALLTTQTVNVIVSNLERRGALTRRPHPIHGRIQQIELSDKGNELLTQCRARVHAIELEIVDGLTADEEAIIRRWLVSVAAPAKGTQAS